MALSASKIRFSCDGLVLTSKLIDGTFPDYERVIPRNNDKMLEVDTKLFAERGRPRLDDLDREGPRGEAQYRRRASWCLPSTIPIRARPRKRSPRPMMPSPIDIGFNSRYLLDIAVADQERHGELPARRCGLAHHHPRSRRRSGALCADADAGVSHLRVSQPDKLVAKSLKHSAPCSRLRHPAIPRLTLTDFRNYAGPAARDRGSASWR